MLKMTWHCDVCGVESLCDVTCETHFFAVILLAKRAHEGISPSCVWNPIKFHGRLLHSNVQISGVEQHSDDIVNGDLGVAARDA